jgi:hypothetical protein
MRWRVVTLVSLGVNLVLAVVWLAAPSGWSSRALLATAGPGQGQGAGGQTNTVLRRQLFSWRDVESGDYPTYVANLRGIGCPEQTIRDIIIADVNGMYARKLATELVTPQQQWWRSEPDTNVLQAATEKARALDNERRTLLTQLLGPAWETGDLVNLPRPSHPGILLDGPVLGALPSETKQALQEISARSEERLQAYLDAQRQLGKPADAVELAKLRQQTRDDLARVLAPGPLEEYLLRYSQQANNLRAEFGQLQFFDASADEFRAVFRATDSLDQRIQLLADSTDPNSVQARRALEAQREAAIKTALGPKRYEEYQNLHDPLYRDAVATAQAAGTPEAAKTIYQISLAAQAEQNAIQNDNSLTADQKAVAMKQLELDQLKASTVAKGADLPPEPPSQPPPRRTYTLRPGDTAAVVAMIYGVPENAIRAANPSVDFSRLRPGDAIYLPRTALAPAPAPRTPYGP